MLEAEIDVFSGMPNPIFQLSGREEQELVDRITAEPEQMSSVTGSTENLGLGYRGVIVRQIKTDTGAWSKARVPEEFIIPSEITARPGALPVEYRLGVNPGREESAAEWLLAISERKRLAISDDVREVLEGGVQTFPATRETEEQPPEGDFEVDESKGPELAPQGATWWACNSPYYSANASLFNRPEYVTRNNCYCFGSNHLANVRFALPGRRGGRPSVPPSPQCGNVIDGLRADGWIDSCQVNTLTIALVIWPGQDYHFYRVVTSGPDWWWGHKPGGTPAAYTERHGSNRALKQPLSPINCNRGPYIHFCGYFYQNNSTAFVA
jgi:hypothetical protein